MVIIDFELDGALHMRKIKAILMSILAVFLIALASCNKGNPDDNLGKYYLCTDGYVDKNNYVSFEKFNGSVTMVDSERERHEVTEWNTDSFVYYLPEISPNEIRKIVGYFSDGKVEIKNIIETKHVEYGDNNSISKIWTSEAEYASHTFYRDGVYPSNRTYKITYYDTLNNKVVDVKYQSTITDMPTLKDDEYYFDGWYISQLYLTKIKENNSVSEDLELFSKWVDLNEDNSIVLTFDTTGGDALNPLRVPKNGIVNTPVPTRQGFLFDDWYTDEALTKKYDLSIKNDMTLYAKWIKSYTVRYLNYDGEVLQEDNVNGGTSISYHGETPIKPKDDTNWYIFSGWSEEATDVNADMDIMAEYEAIPFTTGGIKYTLADTSDYYIVTGLYANNLEEYIIPPEHEGLPVKKIAKDALNCPNAKNIVIPNSVEIIEAEAICNCGKLEKLTIPFIGEKNIYYATTARVYTIFNQTDYPSRLPATLKEITISGSCVITDSAFYDCTLIERVIIKEATKIGYSAFGQCSSLTEIEIPATVTEIASFAFRDTGLKSIKINEGTKKISSKAFYFCNKLETVYMPASIEEVSSDIFAGITGIVKIYYNGETKPNISFNNADKIKWYNLTSNKGAETRSGLWWYYDDERNVVELII